MGSVHSPAASFALLLPILSIAVNSELLCSRLDGAGDSPIVGVTTQKLHQVNGFTRVFSASLSLLHPHSESFKDQREGSSTY